MEDVKNEAREIWASPYSPLGASWDAKAVARGEEIALETADWIEKHPDDYRKLFGIVREIRDEKMLGDLRALVTYKAHERKVRFGDEMFKRKHGLWAGLTRYMAIEDPTLVGDPIIFRKSCIDGYGLPAIKAVHREG